MNDTQIYPNCSYIERVIHMGGLSKSSLRDKLKQHQILMNDSAEQIFESSLFVTAVDTTAVMTVELTVGRLGLSDGGVMNDILNQAKSLGLDLCSVELGPYLRLQYVDQPEGYMDKPVRKHQAPYGSITVVSRALSDDDTFPKGFYVRRIDGALWLRGYRAGQDHMWSPDDHLLFRKIAE